MNPDKKKNIEVVNDDVEELLKAAEDAVLLKFNVNAHTVHGISSDLLSNSSLRTNGQENMKRNTNKNTEMVNDEVEKLLRAAEDAALLKLSANSHTIHGSSSNLHPDLHERFRALKSGSKNTKTLDSLTKGAPPPPPPPPPEAGKREENEGEEDLFARFAALKASLPKPSILPSSIDIDTSSNSLGNASELPGGVDNTDDEDEDEVEKVIRWAKDVARLDPSISSDEDDDTKEDDHYDDNENSDEDDDRLGKNQKGHLK